MRIQKYSYDQIRSVIESKEFAFFEGEMNINLIGVRSKNRIADAWDDHFVICFQYNGKNICYTYEDFTTDPGLHYLKNKLLNPNGCAILKEGQHRGMWKRGFHLNKYEALIQTGNKCTVYRDRDMDNVLEMDPSSEDTGYFGINLHHGYDSKNIGNNSAGCQVFKFIKDLKEIISLCKNQNPAYGDKFTYTLLNEEDFNQAVKNESHEQGEKEIQGHEVGDIFSNEGTEDIRQSY